MYFFYEEPAEPLLMSIKQIQQPTETVVNDSFDSRRWL